jgi:hypothetical protein
MTTDHLYTNNSNIASETINFFDYATVAEHFRNLHHAAKRAEIPGGKLVLAVYGEDPDNTEERFAQVRHFDIGDSEGMAASRGGIAVAADRPALKSQRPTVLKTCRQSSEPNPKGGCSISQ